MKYLFTALILISSFCAHAQEEGEGPKNSITYTGQITNAEFNGDMDKFFADNLKYPADARENGKEGIVNVYCMVDVKGRLHDPIIIRPVYPSIDSEAMRLVRTMPNWVPAKARNKAIESNVKIQIPFKL
jgi:TonB family protein